MRRFKPVIYFIISALLTSSCTDKPSSPFVTVDGTLFRDQHQRELILNGINLIIKDTERDYICGMAQEEFNQISDWGFNVIRLGIIWDGLEPEPGVYNDSMFQCLDERIRWARENGLYVLLDMHQDLYSVQFSDGAPEWATITDDLPHYTGDVWSDAYLISPAVQTAFDNFWNNRPATDGMGIQDHYAQLWKLIAERYADEPTVIGYDLMNEPFIGTEARAFFPAMVEAYMAVFEEQIEEAGLEPGELMEMWAHPEGRATILEQMTDTAIYSKVVCAVQEMNQAFESTVLMDMYTRVAKAIREVDPNHIIFLEHSYFSNPGVPSGIQRITYADGTKEEKLAYAPHGYDLVVDTKAYTNASNNRVGYLFDQIYRTSKRLDMPMLVGEWGAFSGVDSSFVDQTLFILEKFENFRCSQTFWAHYQGMEKHPYFKTLIRPRPMEVAGTIESFSYDPKQNRFSCSWFEDGKVQEPSTFFLPGITHADALDIKLIPRGDGFEIKFRDQNPGVILSIEPSENSLLRELTITF
ncbi:MAG: cellulase family glycosylhydrolase [Bacteroidota bacterium]